MKKILLAVDGGGLALAALPAVAALASEGAAVLALHVAGPVAPDEAVAAGAVRLREVADQLRRAGVRAETELREGTRHQVAAQIAAAAAEWGADLIALGSHGRGSVGGLVLGSVGHEVARLTDLPLLVVPHAAGRMGGGIRRILVAVDSSPESEAATELAAGLAGASGAEVRLVHAMQDVAVEGGAYLEPVEEGKAVLEGHARRLQERGIYPSTLSMRGFSPAAQRIADAAEEYGADIVVVGSRRLGDLPALVQGSTSQGVIRHSHFPVLVAPRVRRAGPEAGATGAVQARERVREP